MLKDSEMLLMSTVFGREDNALECQYFFMYQKQGLNTFSMIYLFCSIIFILCDCCLCHICNLLLYSLCVIYVTYIRSNNFFSISFIYSTDKDYCQKNFIVQMKIFRRDVHVEYTLEETMARNIYKNYTDTLLLYIVDSF